MKIFRTPEERFRDVPDYPFAPHYVEIDGLRMHYVDEGLPDAPPVLLLHGEPSWSYLYRHMIPVFVAAGYRAIAPDLIGFGRSDKPARRRDYTYARHVGWIRGLLDALDLQNITLVCQDWGGLIGLRLAAENEMRFARIVAANTGLPTGDQPLSPVFYAWRLFSQLVPRLPIGRIIEAGTGSKLAPNVIAAYNAPFPNERYKAGARQFPVLVPTSPHDPASAANRAAWQVLERWEKPFLTAFSDSDPITRGGDKMLQQRIPGTRNQPHVTIGQAGHFLQEDKGPELAQIVVDWMAQTTTERRSTDGAVLVSR